MGGDPGVFGVGAFSPEPAAADKDYFWSAQRALGTVSRSLPLRDRHPTCFSRGMRIIALFLSVSIVSIAEARIGETSLQFVDRYGPPKETPSSKIMDKTSPLVEGAIHHTYEYQGWRIRAAFLRLDGPAVRMDFQKTSAAGNISIRDYELQAIMTANAPAGMTWSPMAYDNPDSPNTGLAKSIESLVAVGQRMWRRNDGAILWSRGNLIVRLELPAARQHEVQLKMKKDQKARASVPQF